MCIMTLAYFVIFSYALLGFGLAGMVYCGLEFGSFFEVPYSSPCYRILRGINPILQMAFTFAQMYFVFMASRVGYHNKYVDLFLS